jgi:glutathione synthase
VRIAVVTGWLALQRAENSTVWLFAEALRRGHEAWLVDFLSLGLDPTGRVTGTGVRPSRPGTSRADVVAALRTGALRRERLDLSGFDVALLRHDPHDRHSRWGEKLGNPLGPFAHALERDGVRVINRPSTADAWASGVALACLPERLRPRTLVSRDEAEIRAFVADLGGPAVLKPLHGAGGAGVFRLEGPRDPNLASMVDTLAGLGYVVAQALVPEAADGDLRVVLWEGRPLDLAPGQPSVYRRVHRPDDFRNNVHAGGTRAPAVLGDAEREVILRLGPALAADGMALVGLDLAGGRVLEANVYAPGGLHNLHALYGVDVAALLLDRLEAGARCGNTNGPRRH